MITLPLATGLGLPSATYSPAPGFSVMVLPLSTGFDAPSIHTPCWTLRRITLFVTVGDAPFITRSPASPLPPAYSTTQRSSNVAPPFVEAVNRMPFQSPGAFTIAAEVNTIALSAVPRASSAP